MGENFLSGIKGHDTFSQAMLRSSGVKAEMDGCWLDPGLEHSKWVW